MDGVFHDSGHLLVCAFLARPFVLPGHHYIGRPFGSIYELVILVPLYGMVMGMGFPYGEQLSQRNARGHAIVRLFPGVLLGVEAKLVSHDRDTYPGLQGSRVCLIR